MKESTIFIPLLTAYVIAIAVAGWFVLHVESKQQWRQRFSSLISTISSAFDGAIFTTNSKAARFQLNTREAVISMWERVGQYKWMIMVTITMLVTPFILVIFFKTAPTLEGYIDAKPTTDPVIIALLRGEQLVPPPPLPPEVFSTKEIESERQGLSGASREWMKLDADFRQRLLTVFKLMEKRGYQMALIEGYRSPERQTFLANLDTKVTNAGAYQSYHQYGLAADSAFFRDGKVVISEKDPWAMQGYRLYGEYAESVGLTWGGRWKLMDFGHIELKKPGVMSKFQKKMPF